MTWFETLTVFFKDRPEHAIRFWCSEMGTHSNHIHSGWREAEEFMIVMDQTLKESTHE